VMALVMVLVMVLVLVLVLNSDVRPGTSVQDRLGQWCHNDRAPGYCTLVTCPRRGGGRGITDQRVSRAHAAHRAASFHSIQGIDDARHEWTQLVDVVAPDSHDQQRDRERGEILLGLHIAVGCQEHIELSRCSTEQLTVLDAGPPHVRDRADIMADDVRAKLARHTFVKQHAHHSPRWRSPVPARRRSVPGLRLGSRPETSRGYACPQGSRTTPGPAHACQRRRAYRRGVRDHCEQPRVTSSGEAPPRVTQHTENGRHHVGPCRPQRPNLAVISVDNLGLPLVSD